MTQIARCATETIYKRPAPTCSVGSTPLERGIGRRCRGFESLRIIATRGFRKGLTAHSRSLLLLRVMLTELFFLVTVFATHSLNPAWQWLCRNVSEYNMFLWGCFASQLVGYFCGCLPYFLMDVFRPTGSIPYKIQGGKYPSRCDVLKSCMKMLLSFSAIVFPLLAFGGLVIKYVGISRDGPLPSCPVIIVQIAYFFVVEDYLNYWVHRALHQPWLYKHIHSVHHTYDAPFAIVAAYAHPVELLVQAIPTFVGPLLLAPHLYTLMVWQTFRNWEAIDIHSGYELPFSLKTLFSAYAGAKHHDYHHYMHSGNFASVFTWCDSLYGTDLGYKNFVAKNKKKKC